ncbi:hypothetical protein KCP69_22505 [Salmonella enterica subsp. enterica]|nr:hypothetical protein KCP69_22505 [Salmonella enterica subsp. enterica]
MKTITALWTGTGLKRSPNVKRAIQRHENHGELAKSGPRYLLLLAGLPLLLIAGLIRWRLGNG